MNQHRPNLIALVGLIIPLLLNPQTKAQALGKCPEGQGGVLKKYEKLDVYNDSPFKAGEKATYEMYYYGIYLGKASFGVLPPEQYNNHWLRVLTIDAITGEWAKSILVGNIQAKSYSHPQDFAVVKFRMSMFHDAPLRKAHKEDKWIDYFHEKCEVIETIQEDDKPLKKKDVDLIFGANGVLEAIFKLRTLSYEIGKPATFMVYSSEKNWILEATPIAKETITLGEKEQQKTYDTLKLKMQTYIGKELQQKGELFVWLDEKHPARPIIKIEAEIALGKLKISLAEYTQGTLDKPTSPGSRN